MRNILLVDDNAETRTALLDELKVHDEFRVFSTDHAKAAVKYFDFHYIDLLITELDIPEISGFRLIAHVKKKYPNTHVIAITANLSGQIVEKLETIGITSYFRKPVDINPFFDTIFKQLGIHVSGRINGIALTSFLQLMNIEQKTSTLIIAAGGNEGFIHCMKGEIIGAETGALKGDAAFYKIMTWNEPNIIIKDECQNTEKRINTPLIHLLMQSHQRQDEFKAENSDSMEFTKSAEKTDQTEFETDIQTLDYKKLEKKLSQTPGISNYGIFNDKNTVLNKTYLSKNVFNIPPSDYFSIGDTISSVVGGDLKYLTIYTSDRSNFAIIRSNQFYIAAEIKPGTKIDDIIRH